MADPIISKTGARVVAPRGPTTEKPGIKQGPSRFDAVREDVQVKNLQLPPPVQITPELRKTAEAQLRKKLETAPPGATPREILKVDMQAAKSRIEGLKRQTRQLPAQPAFAPLRERLAGLEAQFKSSGKALTEIKSGDDLRGLLKLQMEIYQLTQNIEITSKVVEQVTSGVKQILQTQV